MLCRLFTVGLLATFAIRAVAFPHPQGASPNNDSIESSPNYQRLERRISKKVLLAGALLGAYALHKNHQKNEAIEALEQKNRYLQSQYNAGQQNPSSSGGLVPGLLIGSAAGYGLSKVGGNSEQSHRPSTVVAPVVGGDQYHPSGVVPFPVSVGNGGGQQNPPNSNGNVGNGIFPAAVGAATIGTSTNNPSATGGTSTTNSGAVYAPLAAEGSGGTEVYPPRKCGKH
ncbi:hypothetical protein IWQ61_000037 [Dispira simplex]|nr:hypothetical protein IWQ61_000037 [Dispira simplex]